MIPVINETVTCVLSNLSGHKLAEKICLLFYQNLCGNLQYLRAAPLSSEPAVGWL